ncbi:GtrA family protein [Demequina soli]|uniref:GtrA family protein n=1 Tax=Demequina soli TaxID=1638987 RepID=UPI000A4F5858|nr:GtrA family protein [Demequina soli]
MFKPIVRAWQRFEEKRPGTAQFLMFFVFSNAVTALQLLLMPLLKAWLDTTQLLDTAFQVLPVGSNVDGSQYFMFDYAAGAISDGGGGGLSYFLSVQITLAIAQIINFFLQRNVTFKSNTSAWRAAFWYVIAYIAITFVAAAAQGFYKAPLYDFFMNTLDWGSTGQTIADVLVMVINSAISFWVFFPIFKIIFKRVPDEDQAGLEDAQQGGIVAAHDGSTGTTPVPAAATELEGAGVDATRDGGRER